MDGILVQLPLPEHISEKKILSCVALEKDVDGFHPVHAGMLCQKRRGGASVGSVADEEFGFAPCTPVGCIELLDRHGVTIRGKKAVVLGRSNTVGMPAAMLLLRRDATVTICHSLTPDLEAEVRQADILIAAIGRPEFVPGAWIKPGAAVIDVGINNVDDPTRKSGKRMVGDVNFNEAKEVAGFLTPVPGGVGPMTIATLMQHTLTACLRRQGITNEDLKPFLPQEGEGSAS